MEKDELKKKILEEEDFIRAPKHQNSLNKFVAKNDKLLQNEAIGRLLLISPEEVEEIYQQSILELRKDMLHEDGDNTD